MSELTNTIKQICDEKGLSMEAVVGTIESALAAAFRKDFGEKNQNIKVEFDVETAGLKVFDVKEVVEDMPEEPSDAEAMEDKEVEEDEGKNIEKNNKEKKNIEDEKKKDLPSEALAEEEEERKFNPRTEIQISDIKKIKKSAKIGDEIKTKLEVPGEFGRMAAQTAKQVIIQRLREAERDMVFNEFKDKEKEVISGVIQRREGRIVLVDLGKSVGVIPADDQIYNENYKPGARVKVYVKEVKMGPRGAEIILSRTADEILKKIFYLEIPEISNGLVELKSVAREAGARSKVAVAATSENIDPIGACVGQRGARIQTIISELGGEKVDIIEYDEDPEKFIANSLSPAKILNISINEKEKSAVVKVNADQLSLAIGKGGQNVRLAARLTGWRIDIKEYKSEPLVDTEKKSEPLIDAENTDDTEKKSEPLINTESAEDTEKKSEPLINTEGADNTEQVEEEKKENRKVLKQKNTENKKNDKEDKNKEMKKEESKNEKGIGKDEKKEKKDKKEKKGEKSKK